MNYWLMKSEPEVFSIDDLAALPGGVDHWEGIRNYQARNFMRDDMALGDQVFFYHSNCKTPGIVGIMEIASGPRPDPTQFDPESPYHDPRSSEEDPRWLLLDVRFVRRLDRLVSLRELKACPELADMRLLQRGNRLSVMPVAREHWSFILELEKGHVPA